MIRFAQVLAAVFVAVLASAGLTAMFAPDLIAEPSQFNVVTDYGTTNLRTLGAPTLSLAVITAIGAFRREWLLLLPAAMYFAFNLTARVTSVFVEGYESDMLRGLLFTGTLAILAQIALHTFRTAEEPAVALAA